jgi:hypothetical protein
MLARGAIDWRFEFGDRQEFRMTTVFDSEDEAEPKHTLAVAVADKLGWSLPSLTAS